MPKIYTVHCHAVPEHRVAWTRIPEAYQALALMAPSKPGKNPDLVRVLQRCPSCVVRFQFAR